MAFVPFDNWFSIPEIGVPPASGRWRGYKPGWRRLLSLECLSRTNEYVMITLAERGVYRHVAMVYLNIK